MFNDIGSKIKNFAYVDVWVGCIASLIIGITMLTEGETGAWGFWVIIGGAAGTWVSACFTYAFGQLVDNVNYIALGNKSIQDQEKTKISCDKLALLKNLKTEGLITADEYNKRIGKEWE